MTYSITTLGCKVNQYETSAMETLLRERGHSAAASDADAVIINTCAVTGEAARKSRQAIRRAKKRSPDAIVAVCGCFSQLSPEEAGSLGADLVSGSGDRAGFVEKLETALKVNAENQNPTICIDPPFERQNPTICIDAPFSRRLFERLPAGPVSGRTRAMLKIEDGCDNFCAYCVIPYARGRVRSLPLADVGAEALRLEAAGFSEIIITGIEISSYGKDFYRGGVSLLDAVREVSGAAPNARLRLGSLEPTIVTRAFCEKLAALGNVCPHFHLSLQSGSDEILRAMGRKYDTARFFEAVTLLREYFPVCGITADLITGFPGETDGHFEKTLAFVEKCAFSDMHIFPYSEREGTRAEKMPESVPVTEREKRARRAIGLASDMRRRFLESCKGTTQSVLFETERDGFLYGHAGNYAEVKVPGAGKRGLVENVKITGASGKILVGTFV